VDLTGAVFLSGVAHHIHGLNPKNGSSGCPWFDVMNHHIDGTWPSSRSSLDASVRKNSRAFCPQMTHCDITG
jgi:hypothetical protein